MAIPDSLIRAGELLAAAAMRLEHDLRTDEVADLLTGARALYDTAARESTPQDTDTAATVAIGRSTVAALELRLCIDVTDDLNAGWDYDYEGPPLDGMADDDEEGVSRALATASAAAARAALLADPADPLVPLQLGHALSWSGDRSGAVAACREALRRDPGDELAGTCLEGLEAEAPETPARPGRRHGFAHLREEGRFTNSEWREVRRLFGSLAEAREAADAALAEYDPDHRDLLGDHVRLTLEIHRPGEATTVRDLVAMVPEQPTEGPYVVDWAGLSLDAPLEPALPPGRPLRLNGWTSFPMKGAW
ncbi:hypothetical protein AB0I28_06655 [Phytomonospora sp. NPDC050363]|uniref:hypothetical protein n=1 Tax=Phytomonospora sp. NPDC050363 TaxID=3155642 RepID=UPI0033D7F704